VPRGVLGRLPGFCWLALVCLSCRTIPPLAPADLSQPGWGVRQGQAVWKPTDGRVELSGELLLATNVNGDMFVQFSKNPFPMATAQTAGPRWRIEFGSGNYTTGGLGHPPARFGWFELAPALAGARLDSAWHFERTATNNWKLWNHRTGETLEGYLWP
jgi:hypothetical protein